MTGVMAETVETVETVKTKHACKVCGKEYTYRGCLINHLAKGSPDRWFIKKNGTVKEMVIKGIADFF